MNLQVQCIRKVENLEGQNVVTEVTFQPAPQQQPNAAAGAVVGTPNAPQQNTQPELPVFNLNGGFSLQIRDADEAAKYQIGKVYGLNFEVAQSENTKSK
jgi:hypothetical protein